MTHAPAWKLTTDDWANSLNDNNQQYLNKYIKHEPDKNEQMLFPNTHFQVDESKSIYSMTH